MRGHSASPQRTLADSSHRPRIVNRTSRITPALITNGIIYAVALQTNGQVLIAGDFQMGASAAHYSLARLNADGSLDSTFRGTNGINGIVFGVGVQSSGRIVVGGNFTAIDGVTQAEVSLEKAQATVTYDPARAGLPAIKAAITDAGYETA